MSAKDEEPVLPIYFNYCHYAFWPLSTKTPHDKNVDVRLDNIHLFWQDLSGRLNKWLNKIDHMHF